MRFAEISFPLLGLTLNPPAGIDVFGMTIYLYGVIIASGLLLAVIYCSRRCPDFGIRETDLHDMLLIAVPLCVLGARLYYVMFNFEAYRGNLMSVFNIREGGLAIYGAVIVGIITVAAVCRAKKTSTGAVLDLGSLGMLIGQSVGRWGNFVNREAFGGETEIFCKMGLSVPGSDTIFVHPTFLYESLWNAIGFVLLHLYSKKNERRFDGQIFLLYVAWYGFGRMLIEGLRTDSLYIPGTALRVSQLLAGVSLITAVSVLFIRRVDPIGKQENWR